jgi:hypothetical protein
LTTLGAVCLVHWMAGCNQTGSDPEPTVLEYGTAVSVEVVPNLDRFP